MVKENSFKFGFAYSRFVMAVRGRERENVNFAAFENSLFELKGFRFELEKK